MKAVFRIIATVLLSLGTLFAIRALTAPDGPHLLFAFLGGLCYAFFIEALEAARRREQR